MTSAAFAKKHPPAQTPPTPNSSQPPAFTIPAEPLGFTAPGEYYLGSRQALVSLDFLDEDRLLFTFRVPGLLHREPAGAEHEIERHIRAYVLRISDGAVLADELWTVRDQRRYLYMLDSGQFVLRDRETLRLGNGALQLTPWLKFPGPVEWLEFDPSLEYLVTDTHEPAQAPPQPTPQSGEVGSPDTARADVTVDGEAKTNSPPEDVLRILQRSSGQVMLVSRVRSATHLPMNAEGYIETLRGIGLQWVLNLDYFTGGTRRISAVESQCMPRVDFVSSSELLASACNAAGVRGLVAVAMDGRHLWQQPGSDTAVWLNLTVSRNGTSLAEEMLLTTHAVNPYEPLDAGDIKVQDVRVLDAGTGKQLLRAQASPIFDAGGNVALSPSGRRAAVLMEGKIQVFELGKGNQEAGN